MNQNKSTQRSSGQRCKKRKRNKFYGNQYTGCEASDSCSKKFSASSRKLGSSSLDKSIASDNDNIPSYILFDKNLLFSFLEQCLCCMKCYSAISFSAEVVYGLLVNINMSCTNCKSEKSVSNSKMIGTKFNASDINRRFIFALRCIGKGFADAKAFCAVMELPTPVLRKAYDKVNRHIQNSTWTVAEESMKRAIDEKIVLNGSSDITVSGDGTWKTRGHSSRFGVTTLIGSETGKIIDTFVSSSYCKGCESGKKIKSNSSSAYYHQWRSKHTKVCSINHSGSSGKMEVTGILNMFSRSEDKYSVRYTNYIGDGVTKTYFTLVKENPYSVPITKIECVGHVQKRMGCRLRKLKTEFRNKKLYDKKPLGGKGRLTDVLIDQLTTYYGSAIRKHSNSVRDMQKAIWAIWYHKRSNDTDITHELCPNGEGSWCPYQKAVAEGTQENFKHSKSVPAAVMDAIKPIFNDLSHPDLLKRCLGGRTQNANESLNGLIWKFCPKVSNSARQIVTISANIAVACFNDGKKALLCICEKLDLACGTNMLRYVTTADQQRIVSAEKRKLSYSFTARIAKRQKRKATDENNMIKEGQIYDAGAF